jgi:hypothetical protein
MVIKADITRKGRPYGEVVGILKFERVGPVLHPGIGSCQAQMEKTIRKSRGEFASRLRGRTHSVVVPLQNAMELGELLDVASGSRQNTEFWCRDVSRGWGEG